MDNNQYFRMLNDLLNSEDDAIRTLAHNIETILTCVDGIDDRFDTIEAAIKTLPFRTRWDLEERVKDIVLELRPTVERHVLSKAFLKGFLCGSGLWAVFLIFVVKLLTGA